MGDYVLGASDDRTALMWNAASGELVTRFRGHLDTVNSAEFSPHGVLVVTASMDMTAKMWGALSGKLVLDFVGHAGGVTSAVFSPGRAERVLTASWDATAITWDAV